MTTPSTERKAGPLLGTGAQTAWPFTFKVFAATDIAVTIATSLGVETALVYGTDYSVALNANQETSPGGTVTYPISGTPLPTGSRLVIVGNLPYDQPLDLPSGGNFSPLALENQLDRLTMQIQQLRGNVGRALQVSVTTNADVGLPAPSANELIGWDSTGSNLQNFALSELATAVAYATMRYDTFTGDGAETEFALTADPAVLANLDVAISGVTQVPGTDYSLVAGTLVFTSAPPNGAVILARYGEGLVNVSTDSSDVRFLPAGTGAEERTVQAKLREYAVTPEDFGAVGNNVADDYQALQAAFDTGKPVYLPNKYFTSTTVVPAENQIIFGRGAESMIRGNGGSPVLNFAGTSGTHKERLTLRDFTIKRTNGVYNPLQRQLVELHYADDCTVENMVFDGDNATSAYPGALIGYSVNRMRIVGCDFIGGANCNLTSEGALSTNAFSTGCVVKNCYMAPAPSQGFNFYYVNDLIVDGCTAHGRTSDFGCGFVIEYQGQNITFTNCIAYDNTRSGFYYEPNIAQGLASVTFNNCIAYDNGETALYAQNSFGLVVNGGAYWGSTTAFTGSNAGIALEDVSQYCIITGAYIHSNQVCGLRIARGNYNTVSSNVFYNNNGPAILITDTTVAQNIVGNTFVSNLSTISGWVENQTGLFSDYEWASYTPVVYSSDGTTTVTISNSSVKYKRIGSTCHVHGYFEFAGSAANSSIYITAPFTVEWTGSNTGPGAQTMRGTAKGSASDVLPVASLYFPTRLSISGMTVSDTSVRFSAAFEIA